MFITMSIGGILITVAVAGTIGAVLGHAAVVRATKALEGTQDYVKAQIVKVKAKAKARTK